MKLLAALALSAHAAPRYESHEQWPEFKEWMVQHNKAYESEDETQKRFHVYLGNLKHIERLETLDPSNPGTFEMNKFGDMLPSEFKSKYLNYKAGSAPRHSNSTMVEPLTEDQLKSAPNAMDWRSSGVVTPVKDQGQCGSCWAFSTVQAVESAWAVSGKPLVEFSTQALVSCDSDNGGCNGGDPNWKPGGFWWVASNGGLPLESQYPYTSGANGRTGSCQSSNLKPAGGNIVGQQWILPECSGLFQMKCDNQDEEEMYAQVAQRGAPSVCVNAENWQFYSGRNVMTGSQCGSHNYSSLDHCVQLTGYDITSNNSFGAPYWAVRNTWTADWGKDGYIYLKYGDNVCGVADEVSIPVF